jgi:PKD repeat protein
MPAPQAPLSPRAQAGNSAVGLFWSPSPDLVSQYAVYRSDDGGGTWTAIATVPGSADTYEDAGLQNGTTYDYVVTSIDGEGFEGAPGPVVSATPTDLPCTLSCTAQAPQAAAIGNTVTFTASAVTRNCTGEPTYAWDFGDGSPLSGGSSATHVYSAEGTYSWSMTAALPGATCTKVGTITIGAPPTVTSVRKRRNPFRIVVKGSHFGPDATVYVGETLWTNANLKNAGKLVIKKGSSLKAVFPHDTDVSIRIVNGDGGSVTVSYNRTTRNWHVLP